MDVGRSAAGYAQLLRDNYCLLRDAVDAFYAGDSAKAIEIATRIRVLVHRTEKSTALLSFIDPDYLKRWIFHKVLRPDAVLALNMGFQLSGGRPPKFMRPDFSSPSYSLVSLERWWNEAFLAMGQLRSSKKQIILDVANKDGGAHVDSKVSVRYAMATEPPVVFGSGDGNFVRLNLARGSVAQAGSELLDYLTVHFRQHLGGVLPNSTVETVTKAATVAGFRALPRPDAIRVPFTRGPNFLNAHTDEKWAFYSEIHHGKQPDNWGKDFDSLERFLHACRGNSIPPTQREP